MPLRLGRAGRRHIPTTTVGAEGGRAFQRPWADALTASEVEKGSKALVIGEPVVERGRRCIMIWWMLEGRNVGRRKMKIRGELGGRGPSRLLAAAAPLFLRTRSE